MRFDMKKDSQRGGSPRRYKFDLSLSGVIGASTVLLLGLVWVFIFGVLVGRGYQPERPVPELAALLPTRNNAGNLGGAAAQAKEKPAAVKAVSTPVRTAPAHATAAPASSAAAAKESSADHSAPAQTPVAAATPAASETPEPQQTAVLGTDELHYFENLKDPRHAGAEKRPAAEKAAKPPVTQPKSATTAPAAPQVASASARPATTPPETRPARSQEPADPVRAALTQVQRETQAAQAGKPAATTPAPSSPTKTPAEDNADTRSYAYVYQVASLTDAESASRFRSKVAALGLKADVNVVQGTNNSNWHRVIVHFQGKPEDTREMKNKLKTLGVEKPLLHSKKPMD